MEYNYPFLFTWGDEGRELNREEIDLAKSFVSVFIDQYLNILETNGSFGLHSQFISCCIMLIDGSETFCKFSKIHDFASALARVVKVQIIELEKKQLVIYK